MKQRQNTQIEVSGIQRPNTISLWLRYVFNMQSVLTILRCSIIFLLCLFGFYLFDTSYQKNIWRLKRTKMWTLKEKHAHYECIHSVPKTRIHPIKWHMCKIILGPICVCFFLYSNCAMSCLDSSRLVTMFLLLIFFSYVSCSFVRSFIRSFVVGLLFVYENRLLNKSI